MADLKKNASGSKCGLLSINIKLLILFQIEMTELLKTQTPPPGPRL